jgi:hypothetical protein
MGQPCGQPGLSERLLVDLVVLGRGEIGWQKQGLGRDIAIKKIIICVPDRAHSAVADL